MNQLNVDWFAAILWTEPEPQPSLVQSVKDRDDVVFEVLTPSTMDNAAYFLRTEDQSASSYYAANSCYSSLTVKDRDDTLFESLRATAMDDAYSKRRVQSTTPTMARSVGWTPH